MSSRNPQQPNNTPQETTPVAQPEYRDTPTSSQLDNFRQSVEKQVFGETILWTKISDSILDGNLSRLNPPINTDLWQSESATRQTDLARIFSEFPEFKSVCQEFLDENEEEFSRILSERISDEIEVRRQNQAARLEHAREVGASTIERISDSLQIDERIDNIGDSLGRVLSGRGGSADWINVGLTGLALFASLAAVRNVFHFGGNALDELGGNSNWGKALIYGGVGAAGIFGLMSMTSPETAEAAESTPLETASGFPQPIENLASREGTSEFLGLIGVPAGDVLDAYQSEGVSNNHAIDPEFLERYIRQNRSLTSEQRDWQKKMIRQIDPRNLYAVVHGTIENFAESEEFQNRTNQNQTVVDWLRSQYVSDDRASVNFEQLWADAIEIQKVENPEAVEAIAEAPAAANERA